MASYTSIQNQIDNAPDNTTGLVPWVGTNGEESILSNLNASLRDKGILVVADLTALSLVTGNDAHIVYVNALGLYNWIAGPLPIPPPAGAIVATGGGYWSLMLSYSGGGGGSSSSFVNMVATDAGSSITNASLIGKALYAVIISDATFNTGFSQPDVSGTVIFTNGVLFAGGETVTFLIT